ncbi:hypothetical protein DYBT9275_02397 [Dyadobacter sp. CECT 9275]|uniref:Uncharacterized protein n=1 Tax=Dyadobacter helix TaxID=2822344 RepID=A0A916JAR3_9BACT|nr:hypothetical protein [Dyadobacter sp. CECT 9275]CAG5000129.1 hypothetical protein DYBT9275_02397 [Dyadobacter sp. CECT 9275]
MNIYSRIVILCLIVHVHLSEVVVAQNEPVVTLGKRREIFVDKYLIDKMEGLSLVMHTPRDEGPVLYFDKPWEGPFSAYGTVIKDKTGYRIYYRGMPATAADDSEIQVTCVANSSDGINWTKPELGLYQVGGNSKNNVVLAGDPAVNHNFSPFLDSNPQAPAARRYKAIGGGVKTGLYAYFSPDGLHWTRAQQGPVFTKGVFDSQNVAFWSEEEKRYVLYFRTWTEGGFKGKRSVSKTVSSDFIHWQEPVAMTFGDTPYEDIYTHQTSPYFRAPHIAIAIGARFMPGRKVVSDEQARILNVNPSYYKDCSDAILMSTRGGNNYDRTFMESFIRPGIGLKNWVSRSNYPALNVVQTGADEMSVYVNQDYAQPTAHVHRYSLRLDGFASVAASYQPGILTTRFFTFEGSQLLLNYATSAPGEIQVEIQDENGKPVPGFTFNEAGIIIGNEISRTVFWNSKSDVRQLAGKKIRLKIRMKDADLYALWFE